MKNAGFLIPFICLIVVGCQPGNQKLPLPEQVNSLFESIPLSQTKIDFKLETVDQQIDKTGLLSGAAGVVIGDIDKDGWSDLFFSGGYQNSRLYKNNGDFSFTDITKNAGINDAGEGIAHSEGVNMIDINGDGWLDLFICKSGLFLDDNNQFTDYGKNLLYINQQDGTFKEQAKVYGLDLIGLTSSAQFFDFDLDGDLDVYFAQLPETGAAFNFAYYDKPPAHQVLSDRLYENRSDSFVDVSDQAGILFERNLSLSTTLLDINQDGWPDLYVANDFFGRDFLYINQRDGTFKESLKDYFSKTPMSSMGSDVGDVNNDGYPDLFVGEMMPHKYERQKTNLVPFSPEIYDRLHRMGYPQFTRNMLFHNVKGQAMQEIGLLSDVYATEWSWGALFFDADMDGKEDLFIANGIRRDMTNMDFVKKNVGDKYTEMANPAVQSTINPDLAPAFVSPNFMYQNVDGYRFEEVTKRWNLDDPTHTRGAAYGDLDNDGDLDLVWNNIDETPSLFRNLVNIKPDFHYIKIKLTGANKNTHAIGATIKVTQGDLTQTRYISSQRGFHSMPDQSICIGVQDSIIDKIMILWSDGSSTLLQSVIPDQVLEIKQQSLPNPSLPARIHTYFDEVLTLDFKHVEKSFNDFKQERLLLQQYSKQGPALAIADVNHDDLEDIYIGGSSGQAGKLFIQNTNTSFSLNKSQPWKDDLFAEDVKAVFLDANGDNSQDLLVSSGSNEIKQGSVHYSDRLYINNGTGSFTKSNLLPQNTSSTSCLASSDFDQDGDTDYFKGSCIVPGDFTVNPQSFLYINRSEGFIPAPEKVLAYLGLRITSATFADINGDKWDDLVIATEWNGLYTLFNQEGTFKLNQPILPDIEGWWQVIKTADIDGDGDQDLIAGNHGLNSIFQASDDQPMSLLIHDFDQNGQREPVLFKYTYGINGPFANRDLFCSQMPGFNNQYYSFESFGKATYANMFNPEIKRSADLLRVYEMRTCWFENKGKGQWNKHILPLDAQTMPVNDMVIYDFNQDGRLDLLLGGGSNSNHYEYGSIDGKLVLLIQNPDKTFDSVDTKILDIHAPIKALERLGDGRIIIASNSSTLSIMTIKNEKIN